MFLTKAQLVATSYALQAFTWPELDDEPYVEFIDSSLGFQVVHILGAAKGQAQSCDDELEQIVEFGIDDDGNFWLFEPWTQEMINAGIWPDTYPATLVVREATVGSWTFRAALHHLTEVAV